MSEEESSFAVFEIGKDGKIFQNIEILTYPDKLAMIGLLRVAILQLEAEALKDSKNQLP